MSSDNSYGIIEACISELKKHKVNGDKDVIKLDSYFVSNKGGVPNLTVHCRLRQLPDTSYEPLDFCVEPEDGGQIQISCYTNHKSAPSSVYQEYLNQRNTKIEQISDGTYMLIQSTTPDKLEYEMTMLGIIFNTSW